MNNLIVIWYFISMLCLGFLGIAAGIWLFDPESRDEIKQDWNCHPARDCAEGAKADVDEETEDTNPWLGLLICILISVIFYAGLYFMFFGT